MSEAATTRDDEQMIRTVLMERDPDSKAQSVLDIIEFARPATSDNGSWTALTRDADKVKKSLLVDLSNQIGRLLTGEADEIIIVREGFANANAGTDEESVLVVPAALVAAPRSATWTALGRDADETRKALLLDLSGRIDALVDGGIAEIVIRRTV